MADEEKTVKSRPNIRIEIQNNSNKCEKMDIDNALSETEDGEIIDEILPRNGIALENPAPEVKLENEKTNTKGIFTTGINIFDKQEQEKLQERARRFALKPNEINNFTDADLEELYESLGLKNNRNDGNIRFDTIYVIGTNNMTAEDILEYFAKYAPLGIEWVDDESCNITWAENISAARALFYVSKPVMGMPAREPCDTFAKEFLDDIEDPEECSGQSILLKNKNRHVELRVDILQSKTNLKNAVDMSEITIPVPPGYWRLGDKNPKAKCLLLRFALKTDKKPYRMELFSKYYKTLGSTKSIFSENQKKELKSIFERNRELNQDKNPWGSLAKNWDKDAQFRERVRGSLDEPKVEIKNPSLLVRLGKKKVISESIEEIEEDEDDDLEIISYSDSSVKQKTRTPRMRMYADEEEEKLKKRKLLLTIKRQADKLSEKSSRARDLRNFLSMTNKTAVEEVIDVDQVSDLGLKLKNRAKNMIFTVDRDIRENASHGRKENIRSSLKYRDERHLSRRISRSRSPNYRARSPLTRYCSSPRSRSPIHRSHERTLHSDRIYSSRPHRRRNSNYSEDEEYSQKPKSKVAVVLKMQKKPAVASTIWSRVQRYSESMSSSESDSESGASKSEDSSSSEASDSDDSSSSSDTQLRKVERPGFGGATTTILPKTLNSRSPLKITMANDRFKR